MHLAVCVLLAGFTLSAVGCSAARDTREPTPCEGVFNRTRCLVMTDFAASQLATTRDDIVAIDVMPEVTPDLPPGVLMTRSGGPPLFVRVTLRDSSTRVVSMDCAGIPNRVTCFDEPFLEALSVATGYRDTRCDGDPSNGCSTPVPRPGPSALAAATTLRIDRRDIPIDALGDHEVVLGEVSLPNGLLTEASFAFVDPWPPTLTILSGYVFLTVRSLEPDGRPFENVYQHGWRPGLERAEAYLRFHIDRFEPGAVLSIKDVVVY